MSLSIVITILILLLSAIAIIRGWYIGSIRQLFSTLGLAIGLIIGILVSGFIVGAFHSSSLKVIMALLITLSSTMGFLIIAENLGYRVKGGIKISLVNEIDSAVGSIFALITIILSVWIISSIISFSSFANLNPNILNSPLVQLIDSNLPSVPSVITRLGTLIDPNSFPKVFVGLEPAPINSSIKLPNIEGMNNAINMDKYSIVKVAGQGCGGIVEGTGFVVGNDLIATNAHVIAGVASPVIYDSNGAHSSQTISFNPDLDFAVLRVPNLSGKPLVFDSKVAANSSPALILGFPGDGSLSAKSAVVLDEFNAVGRNIYDKGNIKRSIYEIKSNVLPGNSGGPLIESNGQVIGVVFAQSINYKNIGYAITADQAVNEINQAISNPVPKNTSQCVK